MTREEAIKKLESLKISLPAAKDEISEIIKLIESPWISVDDDLPCNHEELLSKEKEGYTESVMAYTNIGVIFISMRKYDDGWKWETSHYFPRIIIITHWMPIPELPKE